MISLPNLASILHDTAPGYMAEPELNVSVASSPLLLSNFMLCFIFLQWSYQDGKLYYVHISCFLNVHRPHGNGSALVA